MVTEVGNIRNLIRNYKEIVAANAIHLIKGRMTDSQVDNLITVEITDELMCNGYRGFSF